jgi:hypothetical protein
VSLWNAIADSYAVGPANAMTDSLHRILIPRVDWDGHAADMRSRLVTWEWQWKLPRSRNELVLDFSKVSFMEPWALAMFTAYGLRLREQGLRVRAELDPTKPSNNYLESMGLFEVLETGRSTSTFQKWSESPQNTGLHVIRDFQDVSRFRASTERLTLTHCQDAADALRFVMIELGRNVVQHSGSMMGGVAIAQHFPERRALQVAICDLGRGVRASLSDRYPELRTDLESIRLAVLPHSSGAPGSSVPYQSSLQNAGLGLFFSREIAWRAGGSFWVASGNALLGVRGDLPSIWESDVPAAERVYRSIQGWPGTVVAMDFPVDGVPDFTGILRVCRELADEARRMSGPAGLDFLGPEAEVEAGTFTVPAASFDEDTETAARIRTQEIRPRLEQGQSVIIDFGGLRAPTQSFVHALLYELMALPGVLMRLSFRNCTPSAREVIKAVAAYASYRQIV